MTSLLHNIIPPQERFTIHGEEPDALVKEFALIPAGQNLVSNHSHEIGEQRNAIVQRGGYSTLTTEHSSRVPTVCINIIGIDLQLADLLQCIIWDGNQRNMAWDIMLRDSQGRKSTAVKQLNMDNGETHTEENMELDVPGVSALGEEQRWNTAGWAAKKHRGQRWMLHFHTQRGAQRFARTWHNRPLPLPSKYKPEHGFSGPVQKCIERWGGRNTNVLAEMMW